MIKLRLGSTTSIKDILVSENTSIMQVLADNNIGYQGCTLHLNGSPIMEEDLDATFAQLGITDEATLVSVVNAKSGR